MRKEKDIKRLKHRLDDVLEKAGDAVKLDSDEQDTLVHLRAVRDSLDWVLGSRGTTKFRSETLIRLEALDEAVTAQAPPLGPEEDLAQRVDVQQTLLGRVERIDWRYKLQLTVGACLAITIPFYLFRGSIAEWGDWGYLGAFAINLLSSATVILPAPGGVLIAIMGQDFTPVLIGIAAGIGGTLGGATAYMVGAFNSANARRTRWFRWFERLMGHFGGAIIFTFALIPFLPGDLASLIAGGVRYPVRKYLLYNGLASVIKMTAIAYFGAEAFVRLEQLIRAWLAPVT